MINTLTIGGLAFAAYLAALSALIARRRRRAFWPLFRFLGLARCTPSLALRALVLAGHVLLVALALAAAAQAGRGPRAYVGLTRNARGRIRAWEGLSWRL